MEISKISNKIVQNIKLPRTVQVPTLRSEKFVNLNYSPLNIQFLQNNPKVKSLLNYYNKCLLVIMDGVGINSLEDKQNPFRDAKTPYMDSLRNNENGCTLYTELNASGNAVGLDKGEVGNSEAGHCTIGAGREPEQAIVRIDKSIEDGSFYDNKAFLDAMEHVKKNNSTLHIMGALGYSHTHTKFEHYVELIKMAKQNNIKDLQLHIFTNGEGPTRTTSIEYIQDLNNVLDSFGYSHVATLIGRNIAMDKSNKWDRISTAYNALTDGVGEIHREDTIDSLREVLAEGVQGLEVPPIIADNSKRISDNDAVIFANYRADRAVEITSALTQTDNDDKMQKNKNLNNLFFVCMTRYADNYELPVAFDNPKYANTLLEVLSHNQRICTTCSQKEKEDHTWWFLLGGEDKKLDNVKHYVMPPNSNPETPELSLPLIKEQVMRDIKSPNVNFVVTNFANGDILGHKGDYNLAVKGLEILDENLKDVVEEAMKNDMAVIITADHGNIEETSHTKHTANKVPCYIVLPKHQKEIQELNKIKIREDALAGLKDIAPTVLYTMGIDKSAEMTGKCLYQYV